MTADTDLPGPMDGPFARLSDGERIMLEAVMFPHGRAHILENGSGFVNRK